MVFLKIKEEFCKQVMLPYFDKNAEIILQTDASKKGFGAVILQFIILQHGSPIYFTSRLLTSAEQNIEREAMAVVWGMEKLHYFLYGKKFTLQTDQNLEDCN